MSNQSWIVVIAGVFSTLVACSWWMSGRPGWEAEDEEADESEQDEAGALQPVDTIIFDHSWHVGGMGFGCADCHANVATANDLSENQSPAMDDCSMCHDLDNCDMCHTDLDARFELGPVAVNLGFSHSNHLSWAGDDCTQCHTDVTESAALPLAVPTMDVCLGCHNHEEDFAAGRCDHCHIEPDEDEDATVDSIVFDHAFHVGGMGFGCTDCHTNVEAAIDLSSELGTGMDPCTMCHDLDNCDMCHTNMTTTWSAPNEPEPSLGFSHTNHLSRAEQDCGWCHADAAESSELPLGIPTMDTCLGCHNHEEDYAAGRCDHCHPALQEQPLVALAEFDHVGDWTQTHGLLARAESASCMACHGESMCADCHSSVTPDMPAALYPEAVDRSLLHRGDWLATHSLEARTTPDACARCHSHETEFCEDCHTVSMLTPSATDPVSLHPVGWLNPGNPDFHGVEASLHINSCAACHDQGAASNCVECHAVGRVGGNPHPVGWGDDDDLDDALEDPMCRICHSF